MRNFLALDLNIMLEDNGKEKKRIQTKSVKTENAFLDFTGIEDIECMKQ